MSTLIALKCLTGKNSSECKIGLKTLTFYKQYEHTTRSA